MAKKEAIIFEIIQEFHSQKKCFKIMQRFFRTLSFPVEVTGTLSPYPIVVKVTKPHQSESANVSK